MDLRERERGERVDGVRVELLSQGEAAEEGRQGGAGVGGAGVEVRLREEEERAHVVPGEACVCLGRGRGV